MVAPSETWPTTSSVNSLSAVFSPATRPETTRSRTCCSAISPVPVHFSRPASVSAIRRAIPAQFNFLYFAPYFQDDWKVSSRLTLNLGVRWDFRNCPLRNATTAWVGAISPIPKAECWLRTRPWWTRGSSATANVLQVCRPEESRGRVEEGLCASVWLRLPARSADDKTVVRGGYGDLLRFRRRTRDRRRRRHLSRMSAAETIPRVWARPTPLLTTDQMFPSFASLGPATPAANSFLAVSMSPEPRNPYVQQWSFSIQRAGRPKTQPSRSTTSATKAPIC